MEAADCDRGEERRRLIDSYTSLAAARGVSSATPAAVAEHAGLSIEAFEQHFGDGLACLLAAYDAYFTRLVADVESAVEPASPWSDLLREGVSVALRCLADTPERSRLFTVEALAAGPAMLSRRYEQTDRIAAVLRAGSAAGRAASSELPSATEWLLAAGAMSRVTSYLLEERASELPRLEDELVQLLLVAHGGTAPSR
ncbi:MAG: TetR/AcrR family transcriptional regulator [Solirubrobacterales bacterium]